MWALKIPIDKLHLRHRPFESVSSFCEGFAGGVNFGMFARAPTHPTGSYGIGAVIQDGGLLQQVIKRLPKAEPWEYTEGWPALVHVPVDRILQIRDVYWADSEWAYVYRILVQAGPWLVKAGKPQMQYPEAFKYTNPAAVTQRIAVGVLDDKHVLIMARDATLPQMAQWAVDLGCCDALGGDGGSSAQMWLREDKDKKLVYGNPQLVPNALCWEECEILVSPQASAPSPIVSLSDVKVLMNLRYFEPWEFACPHCNGILVTREATEVMHRLDELRHEFGTPISCVPRDGSLARGFTCRERGGHEANSRHYPPYGDARDISAVGRPQSALEPLILKYFREGGIGVYAWGYHVDLGPRRRWGDKILPI